MGNWEQQDFCVHSMLGQKGWAGKRMMKGDLLGAGMGLVLVSNGRKRDWVRNLNEKKYEVLLFFSPSFSPTIPRGFCGREKPASTSLEHTHWGMVWGVWVVLLLFESKADLEHKWGGGTGLSWTSFPLFALLWFPEVSYLDTKTLNSLGFVSY